MTSNKYVDLRKIENFVRIKCYPEDVSKDKGKKANFRKSCKSFKIGAGHLTFNTTIPLYFTTLFYFITLLYIGVEGIN